jgi:hypothetical protein
MPGRAWTSAPTTCPPASTRRITLPDLPLHWPTSPPTSSSNGSGHDRVAGIGTRHGLRIADRGRLPTRCRGDANVPDKEPLVRGIITTTSSEQANAWRSDDARRGIRRMRSTEVVSEADGLPGRVPQAPLCAVAETSRSTIQSRSRFGCGGVRAHRFGPASFCTNWGPIPHVTACRHAIVGLGPSPPSGQTPRGAESEIARGHREWHCKPSSRADHLTRARGLTLAVRGKP